MKCSLLIQLAISEPATGHETSNMKVIFVLFFTGQLFQLKGCVAFL